jgi:ketosteroid isomerase-like protein
MTKAADAHAIQTLEGIFRQSTTAKDIESVMGLFSDDAVLTFGGRTYTGREQIRPTSC